MAYRRARIAVFVALLLGMGMLEILSMVRIDVSFRPPEDTWWNPHREESSGMDGHSNDDIPSSSRVVVDNEASVMNVPDETAAVQGEQPNDSQEGPVSDGKYGPMLALLKLAGETVDDETLEQLPNWSTVTSVIGATQPIVFGLDKCASLDPDETILAVGGMFNSGTNQLSDLLIRNCDIFSKTYKNRVGDYRLRVRWQTPWGKHEPAIMRNSFHVNATAASKRTYEDGHWTPKNILPVISIRDPYTWMQSMCRRRYRSEWVANIAIHRDADEIRVLAGFSDDPAFQPVDSIPVKLMYNTYNATYQSLAHLWSEWYQGYIDEGSPFLLVRAEDLIFFPEQVTRQVCECAGGKMKEPFVVAIKDLKKDPTKMDSLNRDMASLMARYGSGSQRTDQMTEDDLEYAKEHLNSDLMEMNGYQHPEPIPGTHRKSRKRRQRMVGPIESEAHQPLIHLLNIAGEPVVEATLERLPTWSTVTSVIGATEPIISGLDQCPSVNKENVVLGIAGMFNSESNKLFQILSLNCEMDSKKRKRPRIQYPLTRHAPVKDLSKPNTQFQGSTLQVVTIRDPYTWMQSACGQDALLRGHHMHWFSTDHHCPNLVATTMDGEVHSRIKTRKFVRNPNKHDDPVKVLKGALDGVGFSDGENVPVKVQFGLVNRTYDSLVHVWNEWYRDHLKADYPKLFVRAEDVIFFPEQVAKQVCECAGGKMKETFSLLWTSRRKNSEHVTAAAMVEHGSGVGRTKQLTEADAKYAKRYLDRELMGAFGYTHPESALEDVEPHPESLKVPVRIKKHARTARSYSPPGLTVSTNDKEPLINLLRDAGQEVTDDDVERLPTWTQVTSLIGNAPVIHGLEHCSSFNPSEAILAIAGMMNTGTHLLYSMLKENCDIYSSSFGDRSGFAQQRVRPQVNWEKHELPMFRGVTDVFQDYNYDLDDIVPVVSTRDPYSWMQSMCRKPYAAAWFYTDQHCPNLILTPEDRKVHARYHAWVAQQAIEQTDYTGAAQGEAEIMGGLVGKAFVAPLPTGDTVPVTVHFHSVNMTYPTIAELWNEYYRAYVDDGHPSIQVRVEDLIFFPKQVTKSICECAGGTIHDMDHFDYITKALKHDSVVGEATTKEHSLVDMLVKYGSGEERTTQMTREDLEYAKVALDKSLMDLYGYNHPAGLAAAISQQHNIWQLCFSV